MYRYCLIGCLSNNLKTHGVPQCAHTGFESTGSEKPMLSAQKQQDAGHLPRSYALLTVNLFLGNTLISCIYCLPPSHQICSYCLSPSDCTTHRTLTPSPQKWVENLKTMECLAQGSFRLISYMKWGENPTDYGRIKTMWIKQDPLGKSVIITVRTVNVAEL